MKKVILALGLLLSFFAASAQKVDVGVMGGFRLNHASTDLLPSDESLALQPNFHVGAFAHLKLGQFAFQPQLFFAGRGWSVKHEDHTDKTSIWAIDMPLNLLYTWKGFYVGGGPVLTWQLSASQHAHDANDQEVEIDLELGSNPGQIRPFNTGVQLLAGYKFKKIHGSVFYNFGLSNLTNVQDRYLRTGMMGIQIGYSIL